jgi:Glycosyltransferase family 87
MTGELDLAPFEQRSRTLTLREGRIDDCCQPMAAGPSWPRRRIGSARGVAGPRVNAAFGSPGLVPLLITSGLATLVVTKIARATPMREGLAIVLGLALAMRLSIVFIEPILSTDVYRYVWDGRVQAAGINPYRFVPADPALSAIRDVSIFPNINRADFAVTIYPPVAQAFFYLATRLGETVTVMRLALIACEIVTIAVVIDLLRRFDKPATMVAAYAWHPLPIWEIANNGHIDALMVALAMAGLWLFIRLRPLAAAVAITLGMLVKPYLILMMPALRRPWDWRVPLAVILTIAICYLPYIGVGSGVLGYLGSGYLDEEDIADGDGFWLVHLANSVWDEVPGLVVLYLCAALPYSDGSPFAPLGAPTAPRKQRFVTSSACCLPACFFSHRITRGTFSSSCHFFRSSAAHLSGRSPSARSCFIGSAGAMISRTF